MTTETEGSEPRDASPDATWSRARPHTIPRPTFYPASMAFGVTLALWGFITSPILLGTGALVMAVSLAGWIGEIRHER